MVRRPALLIQGDKKNLRLLLAENDMATIPIAWIKFSAKKCGNILAQESMANFDF